VKRHKKVSGIIILYNYVESLMVKIPPTKKHGRRGKVTIHSEYAMRGKLGVPLRKKCVKFELTNQYATPSGTGNMRKSNHLGKGKGGLGGNKLHLNDQ